MGNMIKKETIRTIRRKSRLKPALFVSFGASFFVFIFFTKVIPTVFALGDTEYNWTFDNSGEYTLSDDDLIEISGGQTQLKVQNYKDDANTRLLMHFDEASGNPLDSSSNTLSATQSSVTYSSGILNNAANFNGTTSYVEINDTTSSPLDFTGTNTIEAWIKPTNDFDSQSGTKMGIVEKGSYRLYLDNETGKAMYELESNTGTAWQKVAGDQVNGSWDTNGKRSIEGITKLGDYIYIATGNQIAGDAEVWRRNTVTNTNWEFIGGDGINDSWQNFTYEAVTAITALGNYVYAGLGFSGGDAELWRLDVTQPTFSWERIGGLSINSGWNIGPEQILSMINDGTYIYVGLGVTTSTDAQVWRYDTTQPTVVWEKLGGQGTYGGWNTGPEGVYSLAHDGTYLYAGLGATTTTDAQVWRFDDSINEWTRIAGSGAKGGWNTGPELVESLATNGDYVFAGLGNTNNSSDAAVWMYDKVADSWTRIGYSGSHFPTAIETVGELIANNSYVYVGLGYNNSDSRLYRYDISGGTWQQLAGNGTAYNWSTDNYVKTIYVDGSEIYVGLYNASYAGYIWRYDGANWIKWGGNYIKKSFGYYGMESIENMTTAMGKLYAGTGNNSPGDAQVWEFDGTNWDMVGGQEVNNSWTKDQYQMVTSMAQFKGELYVGLGTTAGYGDVWKYDGTTWTNVADSGTTSGWVTSIERVLSMASDENYLYVGLGLSTTTDSQVFRYDGSTWTQIGGRLTGAGSGSVNGSWSTNIEGVYSLMADRGNLYAGLGASTGDAEVWEFDGSTWTQISVNGANWDSYAEVVEYITMYRGEMYIGLGNGAIGDAEVWRYNSATTTWEKIGGDGIKNGWSDSTYFRVTSMAVYNGRLYASIGSTSAGDGEVWRYNVDTDSWTKVAGSGVNNSWTTNVEYAYALTVYKGKLYVGNGYSGNADADIYAYGNNAVLASTKNEFLSSEWTHIAATFDGTQMRLRISVNGSVVSDNALAIGNIVPVNNYPLRIGTTYGSSKRGDQQGYFEGQIDEVRISDTARNTFTTKPYSADPQTIKGATAQMTTQIKQFESFLASESGSGTITYRLSANGGTTWLYWDTVDLAWEESTTLAEANLESEINVQSVMNEFPAASGGIMWQAILDGDGFQRPIITNIEIEATQDITNPDNPTSLSQALSGPGGTAIESDTTWYSHTTPYFSWPAGEATGGATDNSGSGVSGYYVYFGTNASADPYTEGTFQTATEFTSPTLSTVGSYRLRIRTVDIAQNVSSTTWEPFIYKFDATPPSNAIGLSVNPSGYASSNSFTFSWPLQDSSGGASDGDGSGVAGYQYKTGTDTGPLSNWSSTITSTSVVIPNAAYQDDQNTFFLRTIDNAGNISTSSAQIFYYYGGDGPSAPNFLTVNPLLNTVNEFSFSWDPPDTYTGNVNEITYCYTVNVLPSPSSCTFTVAGAQALNAGPFATKKGLNMFYLVAKNPANAGGAINYANYTSVSFTADTSAPGIPLSLDIADVSIKSSSSWRLALTWNEPDDPGAGVDYYEIHRSTDSSTFTEVAQTTGFAFVDTGLLQQEYFYKVRACDNVDNCGEFSSIVNLTPTGKFTEPAELSSGPTVSGITTRQATISWATGRNSDSKVQYGEGSGDYFASEPSNSVQKTSHEIVLSNLDPGTKYYYRAKWTDEDGNTGFSDEGTFETLPAPTVKDVKIKTLGISSVILEFAVSGASKVRVYYGETVNFGSVTEISTSQNESTYTISLDELLDGTRYYYKINTLDAEGEEYEGTVLDFATLPRPKISGISIQQIRGTATPTVLISWETNTETSSVVTYYPESNPASAKDEVNVTLKSGIHRILIRGLATQTRYAFLISGRDIGGNEAISETQFFTTATDTRAPIISGLKVEGSNIRNNSADGTVQSQLVITWDTDEPATSQVEFGDGTGSTYSQKTQEDTNLTSNHIVIITGLSPSKVYHLRAISKDATGNQVKSIDIVTITPKATDSAFDLVITNLAEAFGFLGALRQ